MTTTCWPSLVFQLDVAAEWLRRIRRIRRKTKVQMELRFGVAFVRDAANFELSFSIPPQALVSPVDAVFLPELDSTSRASPSQDSTELKVRPDIPDNECASQPTHHQVA